MHQEANQFVASVKAQAPEYFTGKKVLEVGSLDINGSVRQHFTDCDYLGIDLGVGIGVDEVCHAAEMGMAFDISFDVVISSESLEHDERWNRSLLRMVGMLKLGGLLIITCAAPNRPEHGTARTGSANASPFTADYYRNISVEDFAAVLPASLFERSYLGYRGNMDDLYFTGIKLSRKCHPDFQPCGQRDCMDCRGDKAASLAEYTVRMLSEMSKLTSAVTEFTSSSPLTVTAEISTLNRYHTLPLTIAAILNQTRKPERLVIYDDGEQKDLREMSPFDGLLRLADHLGISWELFTTPREGQVRNHQHALDAATTDLIWRVDDDCIPEPNCLESLLAEMRDDVGAVAGLVHHAGGVTPLSDSVTGGLDDVTRGVNLQWYQFNSAPREVEHLYSTFLYRVDAARNAGGYPKELSHVGHREETMFTHSIHRAGYKLIVTPHAKTYHLQESTGGIRSFSDGSMWQRDEQVFQVYLKAVGHVASDTKLIVADMGVGDHLMLKAIWNDICRKHPDTKYTLALCYPDIFKDVEGVTIISIAEAKLITGDRYSEHLLYDWCWRNGKNGQPLPQSMMEFWG